MSVESLVTVGIFGGIVATVAQFLYFAHVADTMVRNEKLRIFNAVYNLLDKQGSLVDLRIPLVEKEATRKRKELLNEVMRIVRGGP